MLSCRCGKLFEQFKARAKLDWDQEIVLRCPACMRWQPKDSYLHHEAPVVEPEEDPMGYEELKDELTDPYWEDRQ